ncbi:MAG: chemotaxis protein CheA [Thermodesulfobacteriota bacterium]
MSEPSNEMDEIIDEFVVESEESLESLDQMFVALEKDPANTDLLNEIFRCAHTIKGAAGFLGFQKLVEIAHVTEDVLNKLRKGELVVTNEIMDAVLKAMDIIKEMLSNIKASRTEGISPSIEFIKAISEGNNAKEAVQEEAEAEKKNTEPSGKASEKEPQGRAEKKAPPVFHKEKEHNIRVDIVKLDEVLNLVGELVLSRNRLMRLGSQLNESRIDEEIVSQTDEAIAQLDLVTSDLQLSVMKMRMQPIARVFNKFPRMVRDLARSGNKEIELKVSGEDTELDKTVIEEIGDPLIHLIRNSVDHGVESPAEREAAGKPACGTIYLSAAQEGQNIVVCVEDDGKGMDPEKIKESAIGKGVITPEEAAKLSAKDALDLIFRPGFSTVKKVSDISGRGVGMDVVKTGITNINGLINIESEVGSGTKIIFRLPLTLAIIQILIVKAGSEIYGIPLANVIENIRLRPEDVKTIRGREVVSVRDSVLPVARLESIVRPRTFAERGDSNKIYVVIIGVGEKRFGLLVDELYGQEEIVMKTMGEYMKGTEGVAGASITGDGKVVLILDVASVLTVRRLALAS